MSSSTEAALFTGVALLLAMPVAFMTTKFEAWLCEYSVRHHWPGWLYWLVASSWLLLLAAGLIGYGMAKGGSL